MTRAIHHNTAPAGRWRVVGCLWVFLFFLFLFLLFFILNEETVVVLARAFGKPSTRHYLPPSDRATANLVLGSSVITTVITRVSALKGIVRFIFNQEVSE